MSKKNYVRLKVRAEMCETCPFKADSKHACLSGYLGKSALTEASRICHCTGARNGIHYRTGKPEMLCRGARNLQLQYFASVGFISEQTDEAWEAKCMELGL